MRPVLRSWLLLLGLFVALLGTRWLLETWPHRVSWELTATLHLLWPLGMIPVGWRIAKTDASLSRFGLRMLHLGVSAGFIGLVSTLNHNHNHNWRYYELPPEVWGFIQHAAWGIPLGIVLLHRPRWPGSLPAAAFSTVSALALLAVATPRTLGIPLQEPLTSQTDALCLGEWDLQREGAMREVDQLRQASGPEAAITYLYNLFSASPCLDTPRLRLRLAWLHHEVSDLDAAIQEVEHALATTQSSQLRSDAWWHLTALREETGDHWGAYLAAAYWHPTNSGGCGTATLERIAEREARMVRNFWLCVNVFH